MHMMAADAPNTKQLRALQVLPLRCNSNLYAGVQVAFFPEQVCCRVHLGGVCNSGTAGGVCNRLTLPCCAATQQQDQCDKQDQKTKLAGLANALLCSFHGAGYQVYEVDLPSKAFQVVSQLRSDPANFTRISKGRREVVASTMKPGDSILL
jgi:hypothetical protein